jgi:hypothetical protein
MPGDPTKLAMMKQVAADHLNSIPAAKSDDPRAFIEAAVNWFGQWWKMRSGWDTIAPGYCALVLNHEFAAAGMPTGFSEKHLFRDTPDPNLGGHIHISDYSLSRVFRDQGGHMDADSICRKLKALSLSEAPTVLFAPQTGVMIAAEAGVSGPIVPCHLLAFDGSLTVPNLDALINGLYDTELKYPETIPHLWRKKKSAFQFFMLRNFTKAFFIST